MNSQYHERQLLLKAIRKYRRRVKEIVSWQGALTSGQVFDTLLARDSVQRFVDEIFALKNLDSAELAYLDLRLAEINELDALLKREAPRIAVMDTWAELRGDQQRSGWWWHLEDLAER